MRLIDAYALKQKLVDHEEFFIQAYGGWDNLPENDKVRVDELMGCIGEIVNAPTVDAVEVIRCNDCIWQQYIEDDSMRLQCPEECVKCRMHNTFVRTTDFCSYGKRKDGE